MGYSYSSSEVNQTIYICLVINPFPYGVTLGTSGLMISHLPTRPQTRRFKTQKGFSHSLPTLCRFHGLFNDHRRPISFNPKVKINTSIFSKNLYSLKIRTSIPLVSRSAFSQQCYNYTLVAGTGLEPVTSRL